VLCYKPGFGGSGKYCCNNDAQLDRINALYHEAPGGKNFPA
jgi:hypothetical protein